MLDILVNGKALKVKTLEEIEAAANARVEELKAAHPEDDPLYSTPAMFHAIHAGILEGQYSILLNSIIL